MALGSSIFCQFKAHGMSEDRPSYMLGKQFKCIAFQQAQYQTEVKGFKLIFNLCIRNPSESNPLHFNSPYHLRKWTNFRSQLESRGHV